MTHATATGADATVLADVAGRPVVLHYGDAAAEYAALRTGAIVVDRSQRHRSRLTGARAADMLTGLVTNDVKALEPGQGQYAAALTAKGKIIADLRILARPDSVFLLETSIRAGDGWMGVLKKYVNPRLAPYADVSTEWSVFGVFGVQARRILAQVTGLSTDALASLAPFAQAEAELEGVPVVIVSDPGLGLEGYAVWMPPNAAPAIWRRLIDGGATVAGHAAYEVARIEAGQPEWGIDIDESTLVQEANFDELHAVSYTKGCYTGQETVARVHFRGHVNRHLRGLRAAPDTPPSGAQLFDESGKLVGDVRSTALSPRLGGVALGMVRREIPLATVLHARWEGGNGSVTVGPLPFPL